MAFIAHFRAGRALFFMLCAFALVIALALPAGAQNLPDERLFKALKDAQTEKDSRAIEAEIWETWISAAPTPEIESLVRGAMTKRRVADYEGALSDLDEAIELAPNYAEAWNQRAFVYYLQGRPDRSLQDLDEVLRLEPRHFGALSGKGRILMEQGRVRLGQKALRQAVSIHPFIQERFLLMDIEPEEGIEL
ncbi:tetratricopeptide repeat protein [Roseibium denhamense]|uniref:TPR repeat-containing protein n=1 Tax=Roseibium denhamense TaxID=76305 RepID=A0ABY1NAK1_9HYPH|nr:tetratricopeptide repeat protein [Roseibium denhamense]MTI06546.1 tetratricopeptide repeat protein [Roseibium denhamense]SMP04863.1 TPR repeat-containing protein [Roseibium denhamense]